jgi:hypothetical protein
MADTAGPGDRFWNPTRTYEFDLMIGKVDLTLDLISVSIITSIDVPYQSFVLQVALDPNDIIIEQIYGQKPLTMKVRLFATGTRITLEETIFELMYLTSDMPIEVTVEKPEDMQKDRQVITFVCVSRKAYTTMNSVVANAYQGATLGTVVNELIASAPTKPTPVVDTQGANAEVMDQILIPTSTLYKNLQYLNRTFGLYDGMATMFCSHDNKVYIKNLTAKMKTSSKFVVYQLPLGKDNTKIIEKCTDGKFFYTTKNLETTYKGTSAFAYMAPRQLHIVKPKDRLFHTIDVELEPLAQTYGLISKGTKIFYDTVALPSSNRVAIHKDHTGNEMNESYIRAKYARRVSSLTEVMVEVQQSIRILELMNVGEAVKLDTQIIPTTDFTDMYILRASHIQFSKVTDWEAAAVLFLIRTNRTLT